MKPLLLSIFVVSVAAAFAPAAPLRSDQGWAIYAQAGEDDWKALLSAADLARGKPVTARPDPNYPYAGSDLARLTDGQLAGAEGRMWTDKRAVGWAWHDYVRVVVDLGAPQPVGRLLARFQVIDKENGLPRRIGLGLSLDGETYFPARSLTEKTHPEDNPALTFEPLPAAAPGIYAVSLDAGYRARFVRLDLTTHGILVCDEIAVLAAQGSASELPPAPRAQREHHDNIFDRRDQFGKLIAPGSLAASKPLRYAPQPNYRLTTDDHDALDLTDGRLGERSDDRIWFERGAVCWQGSPLVTIFADLGEPQPIGAVLARFLGGEEQGGLTFPDELRVLLSADGQDYYLVSARHRRGLDDRSPDAYDLPEEHVAWVHNFVLPVGRRARYLALQVRHQKQFICSDEIAVVRGAADLPAFRASSDKKVPIVTRGVAFSSIRAVLPICANMPLRTKLDFIDARSGAEYHGPCKLILDLPEPVRFVTKGFSAEAAAHNGQPFRRYVIPCNRGNLEDFYLQAASPTGRGRLYLYGDSGQGPENEREVAWEALVIPAARQPKRLHVSLAWSNAEFLYDTWPDYLGAMKHLGFNCVACFPRYWREADVPKCQAVLQKARDAGFRIIVNESPAGALEEDRSQPETQSRLPGGPSGHVCPSYRGQFYRKEQASFGQHAVWCRPDYVFYDIEAYWDGAQEAPRCTRCRERFQQGGPKDWDDFRAAMGREMHLDMKAAIDQAMAAAGLAPRITYGSYRTEPITPLNDGLFRWDNLYPDLVQIAMPSLYVAGNQLAVAESISANRARLKANDIIPWLSTATYGEYEPVRTRDMVLETFANGARGVTYYWYGDFDPAHFRYHAEAIDMVAPVEDLFVDGAPLTELKSNHPQVKLCGMGLGGELAVLVSNYNGLPPTERVKVYAPVARRSPVWDLHTGKKIGEVGPGEAFTVTLGDLGAHLLYLGTKYAQAVAK